MTNIIRRLPVADRRRDIPPLADHECPDCKAVKWASLSVDWLMCDICGYVTTPAGVGVGTAAARAADAWQWT